MSHVEHLCSSPKAWQRFYMGYKERFVDDCCIPLHNGKVVHLVQAPSANSTKSKRQQQLDKNADPALTGCTVWDGAVVLSQHLTSSGCLSMLQSGSKPVSLELGAGTGAVSLSLLAAGVVQRAIVTDIPDMVPHLQANVHHNSRVVNPAQALVRQLRWGEAADVKGLAPFQPPFQLIVGSDLIYYTYIEATPHSRLLLLALQQLAGPETQIYLALSLHHNPEGASAAVCTLSAVSSCSASTSWSFTSNVCNYLYSRSVAVVCKCADVHWISRTTWLAWLLHSGGLLH